MADTGLSFYSPEGVEVYYNPKSSFIIATVYSESLTGTYPLPEIAGREVFVVSRGWAKGPNNVTSWGGITNEEQSIKVVNNVLTWNIPNVHPQQIGAVFAPFSEVKLRFFVVVA